MILVCGSLHLDVLVTAPHLPRLDETVTGEAVRYAFGGKGGNQALAAARCGAKVAMAGRVGTDGFAAPLLQALDAAGIDRAQVQTDPGPSGMSVAIVERTGGYGAVIVSGANLAIDERLIALPPGTTHLMLQNEIPEAVNIAVARRARAAGARIILNAAPARAMPPELLALADLLVVNRVEAADLTAPGTRPAEAAQALAARGPAAVIVTLGAEGLVLWDGAAQYAPARSVPVISTHGAGDAFLGALAAELARGAPLRGAAAFGQAAAALHVLGSALSETDVRARLQSA